MPKHVLTAKSFTREWMEVFWKMVDYAPSRSLAQAKKVMASLFYEPSTRTRLSFEAAMVQEGGSVISTENALQFSSHVKGESLEDTIRVVSSYCDVIVLRHPQRGSAKTAMDCSSVPIINAGDGDGEHPTQALLDAYTIRERFKRLSSLKVAVVGDLLHGRTVHSLLQILCKYEDNLVIAVNPPQLALPGSLREEVEACGPQVKQFHELMDALRLNPDVVYMTRVQKERLNQGQGTVPTEGTVFQHDFLEMLKPDAIVLHPLPRNSELPTSVDADPRMWYFKQAEFGLKVRKALLRDVLI